MKCDAPWSDALPRHWMNLHTNETYFWITLAAILRQRLRLSHTEISHSDLTHGWVYETYRQQGEALIYFLYRAFIEEEGN